MTIFIVPRTVHLASQVLPGAGAYTAQTYAAVPILTRQVTFWITYTAASITGSPAFRLQCQNGSDTDHRAVVVDQSSLAIVQPEGNVDFAQETLEGPVPAGVGTVTKYAVTFAVPPGTTGVRLLARELGDTANPGTIFVSITGEGER